MTHEHPRTAETGRHDAGGIQPIRLPALRDLEPSSDLGPRPVLAWIDKLLLRVDSDYQRPANTARGYSVIRRIVNEFNWSKFGPITVTETGDGCYLVIDGQHRVTAALLHPDVADVPCWLLTRASTRDQARTFVAVNRDRTSIKSHQIYRAQLAGADPDAVHLDLICRKVGIRIAKFPPDAEDKPLVTIAISAIKKCLAQHGDGPVTTALASMARAYADVPGQLRAQMITALVRVVSAHRARIRADRLVTVLEGIDVGDAIEEARRTKTIFGGSAVAALEHMIVARYDKGVPARARLAIAAEGGSP